MKQYTVVYIKNGEEHGRDYRIPGTTIKEIVEELIYDFNRYGADCDEILIYETGSEEATV